MRLSAQQHKLLNEVDESAEECETLEAQLTDAEDRRNKRIRKAARAQVPRTALASAARKSRRWLYNLLEPR